MKPSPLITNVQALRGIAALAVFIAHTVGAERDYGGGETLLPDFLHMGVTGVDLFFLISGFVMVYVTGQNHGQLTDNSIPDQSNSSPSQNHNNHLGGNGINQAIQFFYRRAARIYPLYWVLTIALLLAYAGKKILFGEDTQIDNYIASFLLIPSSQFPIIPVGWTLVHEMYFYAVFAFLLLFPRKFLPIFFGAWAVLLALGWSSGLYKTNPLTGIMLSPLTFEFIAGAIIAMACQRGFCPAPKIMLGAGLTALIILLIPMSSSLYPDAVTDHRIRSAIFTLPYGLALWGAVGIEWQSQIKAPQWLKRLGDASYALYLVHIPMFLIIGKILSLFARPGILDNIILIGVYLTAGIFASLLIHDYIERPLINLAKKINIPKI